LKVLTETERSGISSILRRGLGGKGELSSACSPWGRERSRATRLKESLKRWKYDSLLPTGSKMLSRKISLQRDTVEAALVID